MDASSPNHPSHSIKVSREAGNKHRIRYSRSAAIKSTRNGNELGLHVRILNEESLGRGIQHFSFNGEDTETRVLSLRRTRTAPALDQAKERQDRTRFGQNDSSSNRFLSTKRHSQDFTHSSISLMVDPVSDLA